MATEVSLVRNRYAYAFFAIVITGCSSSSSGQQSAAGSGGASAQPSAGMGGAISAAGSSAAGSGAGGSSAGGGATGANAGSGGAGVSGAGGGGAGGGAGGQGGAQSGGAGGGGGSGGASAVVPSAGCGKSGRPANGRVIVNEDHIYDFPTSYDGNQPMPAIMMMHGANNENTLLEMQTNGSKLATEFVRIFPKSNTAAWEFNGGTGADSKRLTTIYNDVLANYCVDTSRVFLNGHSSGAQMTVQMMCVPGGDKRFKAFAPVAASKYCSTLTPAPVLYIQGMMDAMRGGGNGADVVAVFTASNKCSTMSSPYTEVAACNSLFDQKPVNPGCISYQGCTEPTIWCSHNDNNYNLTDGHEHGWPCFANSAIADFFLSLP
jgi:polyhydroxybutyrate depolymerase